MTEDATMGSRSRHGYLDPENKLPVPKFPRPVKKLPQHHVKREIVVLLANLRKKRRREK